MASSVPKRNLHGLYGLWSLLKSEQLTALPNQHWRISRSTICVHVGLARTRSGCLKCVKFCCFVASNSNSGKLVEWSNHGLRALPIIRWTILKCNGYHGLACKKKRMQAIASVFFFHSRLDHFVANKKKLIDHTGTIGI